MVQAGAAKSQEVVARLPEAYMESSWAALPLGAVCGSCQKLHLLILCWRLYWRLYWRSRSRYCTQTTHDVKALVHCTAADVYTCHRLSGLIRTEGGGRGSYITQLPTTTWVQGFVQPSSISCIVRRLFASHSESRESSCEWLTQVKVFLQYKRAGFFLTLSAYCQHHDDL